MSGGFNALGEGVRMFKLFQREKQIINVKRS